MLRPTDDKRHSVLHSSHSVYRAMLRRGWIDPDRDTILPDAYIPRTNGKDDNGLSVTVVDSDTEQGIQEEAKAVADSFNKTYGVALLNVGKVREIDSRLDVVRDPLKNVPAHALITGVPRPDHNKAEAERLAGQLARVSRKIF